MAKEKEEKKDPLTEALDTLNKKYGKGTVLTLGEKLIGDYEVISTGSLSFDYNVLGVGGFIKGKLYEIRGWNSVGKSTICGHAAASCQTNGGKVLYIDAEKALDKKYFTSLGVNINEMYHVQCDYGEQGFDAAITLMNTGAIDLVIIDSDSEMVPKSVIIDGEVGQASIGKKAKLNSDAYPKLRNYLVSNKVCVIVVSQYRQKIGVMYGDPKTTQGGFALGYIADCIIEISRSLAKEGDDVYGALTKVKTIKNKTYSPYKNTEFEIVFGKGIDKFSEIINLSVELNIVNKAGSWYSYGDVRIGQGIDAVKLLLADNPELYDEIAEKVIQNFKS